MRPLAPLRTELAISGAGSLLIGFGGLAGSIALGDEPVRAIVPFLVVGAILAGVQYLAGFGWVRKTAGAAPRAPKDAPLEPRAGTVRRVVLTLLVIGGAVGVTLAYRHTLAAIVAGVAAGVGAIDVYSSRWIGRRELATGVTLLRESAVSPIAGGRRPVYTLPTSAKTLAT